MIYIPLVLVLLSLGWIIRGQNKLMSQVTDFAATEESKIAVISTKLDEIKAAVAAIIANGTLSQADKDALAQVLADSDTLVNKATDIDATITA